MANGSVQAELVDAYDDGELRGGSGRPYRSAEEREEMVRRFERSGLTQREFAQRQGVKVPTLAYWLSNARRASGSESLRVREGPPEGRGTVSSLRASFHRFQPLSTVGLQGIIDQT